MLKNPTGSYSLPEGWDDSYLEDENGDPTDWRTGDLPSAGDSFDTVFRKLSNFSQTLLLYCEIKFKFQAKRL